MSIVEKIREFRKKYERWEPIAFFILGFVFDATVLKRIDELKVIIQQAVYLVVSAGLIGAELVEMTRELRPPALLNRVWKYREPVLHFLLGTLLNSYTIFYFKSASALTSFIFVLILIALLMLNEFKRFGKSQTQVHMAFWSLCLVSFLVSLAPIILGFAGILPFVCAIAGAVAVFAGYQAVMKRLLLMEPLLLRTHMVIPFLAIQVIFTGLYFAHAIPPVPLSVSYMGIYHDVKKQEGEYELTYTRSRWRFWEHGDQTFLARPGDSIYCFARVFSPTRFKDELRVRWLYWDTRLAEWRSSDAIPMPILGGREEGYRGITRKEHYQPGEWRVQIETKDGREIGRIHFTAEADDSTEERVIRSEVQ